MSLFLLLLLSLSLKQVYLHWLWLFDRESLKLGRFLYHLWRLLCLCLGFRFPEEQYLLAKFRHLECDSCLTALTLSCLHLVDQL